MGDVDQSLFTVSIREQEIGTTMTSGFFDPERRPHSVFFCDAIPPELATNADYLARRSVEALFEEVRDSQFRNLPSRRTALFGSTSLDDARRWRDRGTRAQGTIYRVEPTLETVLVALDFLYFNYAVRVAKNMWNKNYIFGERHPDTEVQAAGNAYWAGQRVPENPSLETLVSGSWVLAELCD